MAFFILAIGVIIKILILTYLKLKEGDKKHSIIGILGFAIQILISAFIICSLFFNIGFSSLVSVFEFLESGKVSLLAIVLITFWITSLAFCLISLADKNQNKFYPVLGLLFSISFPGGLLIVYALVSSVKGMMDNMM